MASIIPGYEYDVFISYRQNDNKGDRWVTSFANALKTEIEATFKEEISVYFDENIHDGLLETHDVNKSLADKLKCLIFIPILSQTYCDPKSFAWHEEFCKFNELAKKDQFGRDIKLGNGNVASRILPIKIHDLDAEDITVFEHEVGGVPRAVEFIFKSPGVNRPLRINEDHAHDNLHKTYYRDQVNKVANGIKEILNALKNPDAIPIATSGAWQSPIQSGPPKKSRSRVILFALTLIAIIVTGYFTINSGLLNFNGSGFKENQKRMAETIESIAILPFSNYTGDENNEYLVSGMHDALINEIGKIGALRVISKTSTTPYKNSQKGIQTIAEELNVDALVEASVQGVGDNVRITLKLIGTYPEEQLLWSGTFSTDMDDILSLYNDVIKQIAKEIQITLSAEDESRLAIKRPVNPLAYEAYLKGKYQLGQLSYEGQKAALAYFNKAIEIDPEYAPAYGGLVGVWGVLKQMDYVSPDEANPKIGEAVMKLISLDSTSADAYYFIALKKAWTDYDFEGSEKAFKRCIELNPNFSDARGLYSHLLMILKRDKEKLKQMQMALDSDPHNPFIRVLNGIELMIEHNYDSSIQTLTYLQRIMPHNPLIMMGLWASYSEKENEALAIEQVRMILNQLANEKVVRTLDENYRINGYKKALIAAADVWVSQSESSFASAQQVTMLYAYGGEREKTLQWLEKGYIRRDPDLPYMGVMPHFQLISSDPRYIEIRERMNLP